MERVRDDVFFEDLELALMYLSLCEPFRANIDEARLHGVAEKLGMSLEELDRLYQGFLRFQAHREQR